MASWPEGDGAGMSTGSCWPDVSVSAQVVDVSRRGCSALVGDEPSRPTGGFVRDGVPDLGPEAPRAPDGGRAARKF